jgi:hypothetical protein
MSLWMTCPYPLRINKHQTENLFPGRLGQTPTAKRPGYFSVKVHQTTAGDSRVNGSLP